jgi:plasmid stabilization system protein ParE
MAFRVEITPQAEQDANLILEWLLSQHADETGLRWFERLKEAIASLAELPRRCALAPENASVPFEMRQLLYGHKPHIYRILFTIEGEAVYVLRIRHGRRRRLDEPD